MMTLETLTTFLGWCTLLNMGVLAFTAIVLGVMRGPISRLHGQLSGLSEADLSRAYFQYQAQYKIVVLAFNFVPYMALRIVA